jgi:hypothetical protein
MFGIMMFSIRAYACRCACRIVGPMPTTVRITPDPPVTYHSLPTHRTSSMWTPSRFGFLKKITASFELRSKVSLSWNGNGGTTTRTPTWNPERVLKRVSVPSASWNRKSPIGIVIPSCWIMMVGYPNREVNSSG